MLMLLLVHRHQYSSLYLLASCFLCFVGQIPRCVACFWTRALSTRKLVGSHGLTILRMVAAATSQWLKPSIAGILVRALCCVGSLSTPLREHCRQHNGCLRGCFEFTLATGIQPQLHSLVGGLVLRHCFFFGGSFPFVVVRCCTRNESSFNLQKLLVPHEHALRSKNFRLLP